ncbi:ecto-NOX disulfide-thiol exchanger 2-like, partial [Musca vetustissima]|uniref:ecto-NOX disulfide-thiol exchanger 2-like n=1 Tax=Musca vetustissima TaxID=27455 RepID=UPI002AB77205
MTPQTNFINHLAAAMQMNSNNATSHTATTGQHNTPSTTSATRNFNDKSMPTNIRRTPEPPPAPILGSLSPTSRPVKPNQGTAPMDLENDDNEIPSTVASSSGATTLMVGNESAGANKINSADKNALNLANGSVYLNSLLTGQIPGINPAFMFFPNAAGNQQTAANNLLESTTMMAVAMQQMQQFGAYGNGALTDTTAAAAAMGGGDVNKLGQVNSGTDAVTPQQPIKEIIKTKSCILFPPNPSAPPPTIRDRPPGCRTVFVGGLPEQITEEILREIFESCGEISTLRMSKKNFCHIRFRQEESIDRAIYLSGYRLRLNSTSTDQTTTFARLHVDYAQARDDQYDYQCKQRQLQREQRHRERMSLDRLRSQSPPPIPHYSDHEASLVAESLRSNDTFIKGVQTLTVWLERGDCNKRNANVFYSMIQSTHAHVRRLTADKQVLEEDLRKARESFRKQMLAMAAQFTQIDKVFNAASHKNQKVWDHFTKAQRKNIDQWKKLATELRSIQIDDDEMEMSDEDRDYQTSSSAKRRRFDSDNLKEENDSLRCQLEAMRNEMSLERTDLKYNSDFREKQMKVLQETIRNMQTQLLQTKMREQKDAKHIEMLEKRLKEAGVKQLLLKTKIKETNEKLRDAMGEVKKYDNSEVIDIDVDKNEDEENEDDDDEVKILEISDVTNEIIKEKPGDKIVETSSTVEEKSGQEVLNKAEEKQPEELKVETKSPSLLEDAKIIALATAYLLIQPMGSFASEI